MVAILASLERCYAEHMSSTPPVEPVPGSTDPASVVCDACHKPYGSFITDEAGRTWHRDCADLAEADVYPGQPRMAGLNHRQAYELAERYGLSHEPPPPLR